MKLPKVIRAKTRALLAVEEPDYSFYYEDIRPVIRWNLVLKGLYEKLFMESEPWPPHTILCECRKCVRSQSGYVKGLRKAFK